MPKARHHDPHDRVVQWVFSRPQAVAVLLRHVLPDELCAHLDWPTLAIHSGAYIDAALDRRFSDILCSIESLGPAPRSIIYIPIEHQSTPDRTMPRRHHQYTGAIWHRHERDYPADEATPPIIIPVVLYQGARPWNQSLHPSDSTRSSDAVHRAFASNTEQTSIFDDLSGSVLDDPLASPGIIALVQCARTLLRLAYRPHEITEARISELAPLLDRIMLEFGPDDIHALWTYVTSAFPDDSPLKPLLLDAASPAMQQQFVSIADALEAKGRTEGLAKAVLSVIETRGLTLPEPLRQRIASCTDEAILHRWLRRACVSTSTQDLLDDAPS